MRVGVLWIGLLSFLPAEADDRPPVVATFSIVACDLEAGEWAVGVQSRVLAVGSIVPAAKAGVGAIATQAWANTTFGPRGLELLAGGKSAEATLAELIASDPQAAVRQVAIVDGAGGVAAHTGEQCMPWAGSKSGKGYSCQGNILTGPEVVEAMAKAYETTDGLLADRVMAAMTAGQAAGGDKRGQQSAALLVVRKNAGYGGFDDRMIDLRVDDHPTPIAELQRILHLRLGRRLPPPPADQG